MLARPRRHAWFFVSGKATVAQAPDLLAILRDMLLTVKLDNRERFNQIVLKTKARREASLVPSGHAYVRDRLRAGLQHGGLGRGADGRHRRRSSSCAGWPSRWSSDWPAVLAKLEAVRRR